MKFSFNNPGTGCEATMIPETDADVEWIEAMWIQTIRSDLTHRGSFSGEIKISHD